MQAGLAAARTYNLRVRPVTEPAMQWLANFVHMVLVRWGYLALAGGLLGECAGLPLPGETILMFSSFVARKTHALNIVFVILVGIGAAVLGDNLGFWAGRRWGPRLLKWLEGKFNLKDDIATARDQMRCHGKATIFWARFIFGLRTVAGPVAGALGMEWKEFLLFNMLGAATWVTTLSLIAFLLADKVHSLADYIEKVSWGISAAIIAFGYLYWRHKKKQLQQEGSACDKPQEKSRAA